MEKDAENTEKITDKRLANLKPAWKEGESANPDGRPKGQRNYATIYKEAMQILADKNSTTPEILEAEMVANGAVLARKGDYRFYKDVLDRLHGQATQKFTIDKNSSDTADKALEQYMNDNKGNTKVE